MLWVLKKDRLTQKQMFKLMDKKILTINPKYFGLFGQMCSVKPVLSGHSKIDKTKILKTNGSLMKVESIAECSLVAFCNTFDLH